MHQQPPKMPLLRSTSAAKAGQVDSSRALTVYSATTVERNRLDLDLHLRDAIELGSSRLHESSGMSHGEPLNLAQPLDPVAILASSRHRQGR